MLKQNDTINKMRTNTRSNIVLTHAPTKYIYTYRAIKTERTHSQTKLMKTCFRKTCNSEGKKKWKWWAAKNFLIDILILITLSDVVSIRNMVACWQIWTSHKNVRYFNQKWPQFSFAIIFAIKSKYKLAYNMRHKKRQLNHIIPFYELHEN